MVSKGKYYGVVFGVVALYVVSLVLFGFGVTVGFFLGFILAEFLNEVSQ